MMARPHVRCSATNVNNCALSVMYKSAMKGVLAIASIWTVAITCQYNYVTIMDLYNQNMRPINLLDV